MRSLRNSPDATTETTIGLPYLKRPNMSKDLKVNKISLIPQYQ